MKARPDNHLNPLSRYHNEYKVIMLLMLLFFTVNSYTQMFAELAVGAGSTHSPLLNPSLGVNINNVAVQGELITLTNRDQPVLLGLQATYNVRVNDITIQPGAGAFYEWFSTDKYDAAKNKSLLACSLKVYYKKFFIEAKHADAFMALIGIKLSLLRP